MRLLSLILVVLWVQLYAQDSTTLVIHQHDTQDSTFLSTLVFKDYKKENTESSHKTFTYHPNPAKGYIRALHTNKTPKYYHLYLRDIFGYNVYTFYESINAESDLDLFAKVPKIMPGQYFLVLMSGEEEVAETLRIEIE